MTHPPRGGPPEKISFEVPIYTYQIDFARHVSNIVFVQWMEVGRIKLLEAVGLPVHEIYATGLAPILIETQIAYKQPLYLGDTVRVEVWLSELGNASAWIEFRFYGSSGALAASGRQKGAFVSTETLRPMRLGPEQRQAFERFLDSGASRDQG